MDGGLVNPTMTLRLGMEWCAVDVDVDANWGMGLRAGIHRLLVSIEWCLTIEWCVNSAIA